MAAPAAPPKAEAPATDPLAAEAPATDPLAAEAPATDALAADAPAAPQPEPPVADPHVFEVAATRLQSIARAKTARQATSKLRAEAAARPPVVEHQASEEEEKEEGGNCVLS